MQTETLTTLCIFSLQTRQQEPQLCLLTENESHQLRVLLLERESSMLLSPFHRHRVELQSAPLESDLLDNYLQGRCYRVTQWQSFIGLFRPLARSSDAVLKELLQTILTTKGFFLQMHHSWRASNVTQNDATLQKTLRQCLQWSPMHPSQRLAYFNHEDPLQMQVFHDLLKQRLEGRLMQTICTQYEAVLKQQMQSLLESMHRKYGLDRKKAAPRQMRGTDRKFGDCFLNDGQALDHLLRTWRSGGALRLYLTHHLLSMRTLRSVYRTLSEPQRRHADLLATLPTMTSADLQDCELLTTFLVDCLQCPQERRLFAFNDVSSLTLNFRRSLNNLISTLKEKHENPRASPEAQKKHLLERLMEQLLLPLIEKRAARHGVESGSSVEALSVQDLLYYYCMLFDLNPEEWRGTVTAEMLSAVETTVPSTAGSLLFTVDDFPYLLNVFWQRPTQSQWTRRKKLPRSILKTTKLFFLASNAAALALEQNNNCLLLNHFPGQTHLHQATESDSALQQRRQGEEEKMQLHFVVASLNDVANNEDLRLVRDWTMANFFTTTILREKSNHGLIGRLVAAFTEGSSLDMKTVHRNNIFCSGNFADMQSTQARETIIVPDCHTLSAGHMNSLLKWLLSQKRAHTIRRVILLGTLSFLPCSTGQPFLDAIRVCHPLEIFSLQQRARDEAVITFSRLLEKQWRLVEWHRSAFTATDGAFLATQAFHRQNGLSLLYHTSSLRALASLLDELVCENGRTLKLDLIVLYRRDGAARSAAQVPAHASQLVSETRLARGCGFSLWDLRELDRCPALDSTAATTERRSLFIIDRADFERLDRYDWHALFTQLTSLIVLDRLVTGSATNALTRKSRESQLTSCILSLYGENRNLRIRESAATIC